MPYTPTTDLSFQGSAAWTPTTHLSFQSTGVAGDGAATLGLGASGAGTFLPGYTANGQATVLLYAGGSGTVLPPNLGAATLALLAAGAGEGGWSARATGAAVLSLSADGSGEQTTFGVGIATWAADASGGGYVAPAGTGQAAWGLQATGQAVHGLLPYPPLGMARLSNRHRAPWGAATKAEPETHAAFGVATALRHQRTARWTHGAAAHRSSFSAWTRPAYRDGRKSARWDRFGPLLRFLRWFVWIRGAGRDARDALPWAGPLLVLQPGRHSAWFASEASDHRDSMPWGGPLVTTLRTSNTPWNTASKAQREQWIPWTRFSRPLSPGWGQSDSPADPWDTVPPAPVFIIPARFFMAVHSVTLQLLPGLTTVPIYDVSLSADAGSFGWSFSATGPASIFDALAPAGGVPQQVKLTLDGIVWVFVVDALARSREFGKTSVRVSGRSATALIGQPYNRAAERASAAPYNAQQLAAQALDLTGVTLDWGITDWLVPAGAWSHTGTALEAVQRIAEAAGGYVNSHRSAPTLLVRHPYPLLPGGVPGGPWNWGGAFAADVELAPDALITTNIERKDGPDVNGVYVSGTSQGVLALVKRTGSAADKLAQMVADPLITATEAAEQRGLAVLGAAGAKHHVQITMPVLTGVAQPGVLDVGQLVQINESTPWRGRVRAVSVDARMPTLRQSVTIERHLA